MQQEHQDRYVPADTNGGWPFAGFIIALMVAFIVMATVVHKHTWKQPTDVTWQTSGDTIRGH